MTKKKSVPYRAPKIKNRPIVMGIPTAGNPDPRNIGTLRHNPPGGLPSGK